MRTAEISRETRETKIKIEIDLDGKGEVEINTGVQFFNHLINSLATHSWIDIKIYAEGDLKHHIIEDVAICLGKALRKAIKDVISINRFGYAIVPMDCSLAFSSIDLINRAYSKIDLKIEGKKIEDMAREDIIHFLETLSSSMQSTIHLWVQYGKNDHHKVEAAFKALALAFRQAFSVNIGKDEIPSSKGTL